MKAALALLTAAELPPGIMAAVATGAIPKGDLSALCELVAKRAREEMRDAAARTAGGDYVCTYEGCTRADHLAARRSRVLPVTPDAIAARGTRGEPGGEDGK